MRALDAGSNLASQGIELRLWRVDLDAVPLEDTPSAAEQQRAARFVRPADGRRYLAAHAALRQLLGTREAWVAGENGKPALASPPPHFNLSRRDGVALIGMSATHEIGVDVEPLQAMADADELAQLHFTPHERDDVQRERGAARDRAFLRCWTRKEACMKATGLGLSLAPSSFECGAQAVLARVQVSSAERAWTLLVHSPPSGDDIVASWALVMACGPSGLR
jgi:4'-phosphopantetheinyl transferase